MRKSRLTVLLLGSFWMTTPVYAAGQTRDTLPGKWELRKRIGGWSGLQTFPPGNGTILYFTGTGYKRYQKGKLVNSGRYRTYPDSSAVYHMPVTRIEYIPAARSPRYFFEWENHMLVITMDVFDGSSSYYIRVKE